MSCCGGGGARGAGGGGGGGGCGDGDNSLPDGLSTVLRYLRGGVTTDASKVVDGKRVSPPSGMPYRLHGYPP